MYQVCEFGNAVACGFSMVSGSTLCLYPEVLADQELGWLEIDSGPSMADALISTTMPDGIGVESRWRAQEIGVQIHDAIPVFRTEVEYGRQLAQ